MNRIAALEAASYATWTADESDILGGWDVTATSGVTRRINSARAIGDATVDDITLGLLDEWFRLRNIPFVVRQTPLMSEETSDAVRERWGFGPVDETRVLTRSTARGEESDVQMVPITHRGFQSDLAELNRRRSMQDATIRRIYRRVEGRGAGAWLPGRGVAAVVRDGDRAAVFSVAVSPDMRRTGLATSLMRAASSWAKDQGVRELFVQVLGTNMAAIELYEGLGFTEQYRYRYLQPSPDHGSA